MIESTFNKYIAESTAFNYINPTIIEERKLNAVNMDVFSRLMMERIIFIGTQIDSDSANIINAQLQWLDSLNHNPIKIYINSPGGNVYDGLAIYDMFNLIESPVHTVCMGLAASMSSILLAAGEERYALPHSRIMIHQPLGGVKGQASDIVITANEITKIKDELNNILSKKTGQPLEKIIKDTDRDYYMTAKEALEYGIIDKIIEK